MFQGSHSLVTNSTCEGGCNLARRLQRYGGQVRFRPAGRHAWHWFAVELRTVIAPGNASIRGEAGRNDGRQVDQYGCIHFDSILCRFYLINVHYLCYNSFLPIPVLFLHSPVPFCIIYILQKHKHIIHVPFNFHISLHCMIHFLAVIQRVAHFCSQQLRAAQIAAQAPRLAANAIGTHICSVKI